MSTRTVIERKLRDSGFGSLEELVRGSSIEATQLWTVALTSDGIVGVIQYPPGDTAIRFDGWLCPFEGVTLFIEAAVVKKWRLFDSTPDS